MSVIFSEYFPINAVVRVLGQYSVAQIIACVKLRLPRYSNGFNPTLQLLSVMSVIQYQRLLAPWKNFNILKSLSCSKIVMRGSHDSICKSWETSGLYILDVVYNLSFPLRLTGFTTIKYNILYYWLQKVINSNFTNWDIFIIFSLMRTRAQKQSRLY